jgi:hypothetical protein
MPNYIFRNIKTGENKEFFFHMNDSKNPGADWERVFTTSAIGVDGKIDAFSKKEFVAKTGSKTMTQGDYWNLSAELSQKRKSQAGTDPVLNKYYDSWSKKRKGKLHPDVKKEKLRESINKAGVIVEE